jgi:hypothetical protein
MIKLIIALLECDDFIGHNEIIDIAKGVNEIPSTIKERYKQQLRKHGRKNNN